MIVHRIKIEENYLKNLLYGLKKSEIRLNDRDYQSGDILEFVDYSEYKRTVYHYFKISHIHSGLGLEENYVCLSLNEIKNPNLNA